MDRNAATVSAFDAGFQHGVGLFETMLACNGIVYQLNAHMQRLAKSAKDLRLADNINIEALAEAVNLVVTESALDHARVRLTLTGGDLNLLQSKGSTNTTPTILIVAQPATKYPRELFENGTAAIIADDRLNPFDTSTGHKTLNYWSRLQTLQQAASRNASEAIMFSITNHVMSGAVSSLFIVKENKLYTPIARGEEPDGGIRSPVLPGITRSVIITLAEKINTHTSIQMLDINDLLQADEVFLTNSSWGVLPVVRIENEQISTAKPGTITLKLRQMWLQEIGMPQ